MESDCVIAIEGVRKAFGGERVLQGVDLCVPRGRVTTVLGKSGAGKSVLMKCVAGLVRPDAGKITVNGEVFGPGRSRIPPKLSYMFQNNALLDGLTAFENVALPLQERTRLRRKAVRRRVSELFERLDLEDVDDKYPSQLSGGMQKRVALARALAMDPEIILFDEPTTGLDPLRKVSVFNMIDRYQRQFGFTAVLVSHDLPDSLFISDKVAVLDGGRIGFEGAPVDLQAATPEIQATFLQSVEDLRNEVVGLPRAADEESGTAPRLELRFDAVGERREGESGASANLRAAMVIRAFRRVLPRGWRLAAAGPWAVAAVGAEGDVADPAATAEAITAVCRETAGGRPVWTAPARLFSNRGTPSTVTVDLPFPEYSHEQAQD
ncbi:MAG: ATP-binding cassette domain-containing protein [Opitutales bacterium]|nr:ATP-binding cassette domain-containing protein [Opitutales bacterium]